MDGFLPILGNGEHYVTPEKSKPGPPINKKNLPTFEEARNKLLTNIKDIKDTLDNVNEPFRVNEVVLNLKMLPGFTAKSFHPNALIRHAGAVDIGSKKWTTTTLDNKNQQKEVIGKQIFLRMSDDSLKYFERQLHQKEGLLPKGLVDEVLLIEDFFFGDNTELLKSFDDDWESGRIELVLHPFGDLEDQVIDKFVSLYQKFGGNPEKFKWRSYYPGPLFMSLFVNREILKNILFFNPIRTAHPLRFRGIPDVNRSLTKIPMPKSPGDEFKSSIIVGMFDGGVDDRNTYFNKFVNVQDAVSSDEDTEFMKHGNAVAGSLLYGNLQGFKSSETLPVPPVTVESFRVLPLSDPTDPDLYEVIDAIEEHVPKRDDIKVFNLSLGPEGAIEDDYISRFTYVIDRLSGKGERLFVVAVGNDGDHPDVDERRIQAPADTINNLAVGAFTFESDGVKVRAPYSCIGEGREGGKVKPDVVAFGGCEQHPFHLVGYDGKNRMFDVGTSFSAPLVAAKAAEIIGRCGVASPLIARSLIIHSASHPNKKYDKELGYGVIPDSVEEIMGCSKNKVTVLYKQHMLPKQFSKLQIPVVSGLDYDGPVDIRWTIAIATTPNGIHTEDYTTNCIEDTFYPNINTYIFKAPKGASSKKKSSKLNIKTQQSEVQALIHQGWVPNKYPITKSGNQYLNEQQRRANFKWDSVVKRDVSFNKYSELDSPYLILHAMDRNIQNPGDFFHYAIAVTVHYTDYQGDAYTETLRKYNKLQTIQVKSRNEVLIK